MFNNPGRANQHKKQATETMIEQILLIAVNNPSGFTVSLPELEFITEGIIVSYEATQNSFGAEGLERVIEHAMKHNQVVGGWMYEGKFYFDSNRVFTDLEEAIKFGKEQKQIAVFDLTDQRLIKL